MRYFLDCEFNEFGGDLLSMAIVRDDGDMLYLRYPKPEKLGPWVAENVWPIMDAVPPGTEIIRVDQRSGADCIARYFAGDERPDIVTDWPDDVAYFCKALIVGPGQMVAIPGVSLHIVRVDAYPTALTDAVQHNAAWDALALRALFV